MISMNKIRHRIQNLIREVVVQGDLFVDKFRKDDERIAHLQSEVGRRYMMIAKLEAEVSDWQSRDYKPNTKPITDTNRQIVSIGQVNERKRQNEISGRQQRIQRLKDEIIQLKLEM